MKLYLPFRHRWRIPVLAFGLAIVWLLTACGSKAPQTVNVGVVNLLPEMDGVVEGFKSGLTELGHTEGENINYIYAGATGNPNTLQDAAQELVQGGADLILCVTTPACLAAQEATDGSDVEVVFVAVTDPVAAGLVQDLSQPGGNVTGITVGAKDAVNEGRRLGWLLQMAPQAERIYVPYNPEDAAVMVSLAAVREAASSLGVELVLQEARTAEEVSAALGAIPADADALFVLADRVVVADVPALINTALAQRLPLSTPNPVGPELGALMSFGSDFAATGKQAARLADHVLKGTQPADLPVETPEFFLTINLQTAATIGLDIPEEVLRQADTIIR